MSSESGHVGFEIQKPAFPRGERLARVDFQGVDIHAKSFVKIIHSRKEQLIKILTTYETHGVALDEIDRTVDLLTSLSENREYFSEKIGAVAVFMPSNQPLYAFACFALVPAYMADKVYVKAPEVMKHFFFDMMNVLDIGTQFPNIEVSKKTREDFVTQCSATKRNPLTNAREPVIDAVIFTGTTENADRLRKRFAPRVLFIANGSGHNPIVVTESADVERAVKSILRVQLYNQGQDCAAPNTILVHRERYIAVLDMLRTAIRGIRIGDYADPATDIGPITREETLPRIQEFLIRHAPWIDGATQGVIRIKTRIVEPTIIAKPLREGANYEEVFAPVFFIQQYEHDGDLANYFETEVYRKNAMFVSVFGHSDYVESLVGKRLSDGSILHDESTIIRNTDLHAPGVERGVKPYGGYGRGASCLSLDGITHPCPTLPQRDLYDYIVCGKKMKSIPPKEEKRMNAPRKQGGGNTDSKHWAEVVARNVMTVFPDKEVYTCAAGISPSGVVHFGNFRDVITAYAVVQSLKAMGKNTRLIFSWDDFDRFRKVPQGIDASFEQYIGMPLSAVPCPEGMYSSYAEKFEKEFEAAMTELGITLEYRYQTKQYCSGAYDERIIQSLRNREKIADILLSFMTEKGKVEKSIDPEVYREEYYPISVYSRFSGKDNTKVLAYDGESTITYKCFDTGRTDTIDFTKERVVKLSWKIDWPMRWGKEGVVFEPGGHDHASPGGSFDVSQVIAREVFGVTPPVFQEYLFVGIQGLGSKMSGSKGNAISPGTLLEIYTPELLKWMYLKKLPTQTFELSFGSEIYKQYSEFDDAVKKFRDGSLAETERFTLELAGVDGSATLPDIPFRQSVGFGQIVRWNAEKLLAVLHNMNLKYEPTSISSRFVRARMWLDTYNKGEAIEFLKDVNTEYLAHMDSERREHVQKLTTALKGNQGASIEELERLVYDIPKRADLAMQENAVRQKNFFKDVYNLLIGKNAGPRLSTFLWAADRNTVLALLSISDA